MGMQIIGTVIIIYGFNKKGVFELVPGRKFLNMSIGNIWDWKKSCWLGEVMAERIQLQIHNDF